MAGLIHSCRCSIGQRFLDQLIDERGWTRLEILYRSMGTRNTNPISISNFKHLVVERYCHQQFQHGQGLLNMTFPIQCYWSRSVYRVIHGATDGLTTLAEPHLDFDLSLLHKKQTRTPSKVFLSFGNVIMNHFHLRAFPFIPVVQGLRSKGLRKFNPTSKGGALIET